jgi:hypothetical protein
MFELVRSDNPVLLSWLEARLTEAGIEMAVFDAHTSSAFGGTLGTVVRRVMVAEEDFPRASKILAEEPGVAERA